MAINIISLKETRLIYHFVYKTTNTITNKFYIGKHSTTNLDDGYLGSGIVLSRAIKKYGKDKFTREILQMFDSESDALDFEISMLTEDIISDKNCYNIASGGQGGNLGPAVNSKIGLAMSTALKGKPKSDSHKKSIGRSKLGKTRSDETKKQISNSINNTLSKLSESEKKEKFGHLGQLNGFYNKSHSDETKAKIRATIGDSRKGSLHPRAKPIIFNGVSYGSKVECMQKLGIAKHKLNKLLGENK